MTRSQLLVAVGGTLAGVAFVMGILGIVYQPWLVLVAIPFMIAAYVIWFHGTGRLEFRRRARARRERAREGFRAEARGDDRRRDGDGANWSDPEWQRRRRRARGAGRRADGPFGRSDAGRRAGTRGRQRRRGPGPVGATGPTPEEAYDVLGLEPGSSEEEIRAAYRSKVKEVHPDQDGGDEEAFKRVNDAYERLT